MLTPTALCLCLLFVGCVVAEPQYAVPRTYGLPAPASTLTGFQQTFRIIPNGQPGRVQFPFFGSTETAGLTSVSSFNSHSELQNDASSFQHVPNPAFQHVQSPNFAARAPAAQSQSFSTHAHSFQNQNFSPRSPAVQSHGFSTQAQSFQNQGFAAQAPVFQNSDGLELLPPKQHVVGTRYPGVDPGPVFRFPASQIHNTSPPSNIL